MTKCYNCDIELTSENESEEHVILNACGGKLKSKKLLCLQCNALFGSSIDASLAKSLNPLANILKIKRERGSPQPILGQFGTVEADAIWHVGERPILRRAIIEEQQVGNQMRLSIKARNSSELKKVFEGMKRKKYPELPVDQLVSEAAKNKSSIRNDIKFQISIGSEDDYRAITKIGINYFIYCGGARQDIYHLIPYIMGHNNDMVSFFFYPEIPPYNPKASEFSHVLFLSANSKTKLAVCYVELFNMYCFSVTLSTKYEGPDINSTYCYDLIEHRVIEEVKLNVQFNIGEPSQKSLLEARENMSKHLSMAKDRILKYRHP